MSETKKQNYLSNWNYATSLQVAHARTEATELAIRFGIKTEKAHRAICHLIACHEVKSTWKNSGWCRIPAVTWRKLGGPAVSKALREAGIISVAPYDKDAGLCFGYRLTSEWLTEYHRLGVIDTDRRIYNLFTGRLVTKRPKTRLKDETGNYHYGSSSHVCQQALKILSTSECVFDRQSFLKEFRAYCHELEQNGSEEALGKLANIRSCARPILNSSGNSYRLVHDVTSTGRQQEILGGLQGISTRIKKAAWQDMIERGEAFNYDMLACQPRIYLKIANSLNSRSHYERRKGNDPDFQINTAWLTRYVEKDDFRQQVHADLVVAGVSDEDDAKAVVLGYLMGLGWDGLCKITRNHKDALAVRKYLAPFGSMIKQVEEIVTGDLRVMAYMGWSSKSRPPRLGTIMKITGSGRGAWVENSAGKKVNVMAQSGEWIDDWHFGRVMAFILQGAEIRFISEVIVRCHMGNISIYSPQHDGLVTNRKIPRDILDTAAKVSGLGSAAKMRLKDFKIKNDKNNECRNVHSKQLTSKKLLDWQPIQYEGDSRSRSGWFLRSDPSEIENIEEKIDLSMR